MASKIYINFINALRRTRTNVNARMTTNYRWHAKVAIIRVGDIPVFAIVGSSNLTGPAFGSTSSASSSGFAGNFNREADIIFCDINNQNISTFMREYIQERMGDLIRAPYLPGLNGGRTIGDRLQALWDEILSEAAQQIP